MRRGLVVTEDNRLWRRIANAVCEVSVSPVRLRSHDPLQAYDLLVLDAGADRLRAAATCRAARTIADGPIVALCRARASLFRALLLESGADQVVETSSSLRELVAVLTGLLRRSHCAAAPQTRSNDSGGNETTASTHFEDRQTFRRVLGRLALTETERRLLDALMGATGPIAASDLLDNVFPGRHSQPDSPLIRVHIHRLRRKLEPVGVTVRGLHGFGYRIGPMQPRRNLY